MAYKSQTEKTIKEIKKQFQPFVDIHKEIKRFTREQERINRKRKIYEQYKKQQREIKLQKWENRINWLADKINEHKQKKKFGKTNSITNNIIYRCNECGTEFKENANYCPGCGCKFENVKNNNQINEVSHKERNNQNNKGSHVKEKLLEKTKINIKKDVKKYSRENIVEEINDIIKLVNDNYNEVVDYVQNRLSNFDEREFSIFKSMYEHIFGWIEEVEKDLKRYSSKEQAKESYRKINMIYKRSCELNEGILNKEKIDDTKEKIKRNAIPTESRDEEYSYDYNEDDENLEDIKNNDIVYRELEDWQQREVDEGNYDSYNFEEDELEEDDYYYEDDKE